MRINLQKLEEELDKKYKENDLLSKIVQRYSPKVIAAGMVLAAIAAPVLGIHYSSAKRDYEQQVRKEARQEALQYKEECAQELIKQKNVLDAGWEQVNKKSEELCQKEKDIDFREMKVDSTARIAEFDGKYLAIKEQLIQAKKDIFTKKLDEREYSLDAKEEALRATEKRLEKILFDYVKGSLPFYK